ncbi:MAG: sigma-E processing peptidase SpoIIGA [Clostridia bacterium]|nr:sigma-E processing peptidase SpoIIGA [Clostridia bacterium]
MSVYIELVIFNNFFVDVMLAIATGIVRRKRMRVWRILLMAVVGSAAATAYAIAPTWAQILTRVLLAPLLCIILFKPQGRSAVYKIGDYIATLAVFILLTFFTGGVIYGVSYALGVDVKSYAVLGISAIGISALMLSAKLIVRKRNAPKAAMRKVTVSAAGKVVSVEALCDSGNLLVDEVSGLPVVILSKSVEESLNSPEVMGFIQVSTVGGEDSLALVNIDELSVDGKSYKALGALSHKSFAGFDVILQNSMF